MPNNIVDSIEESVIISSEIAKNRDAEDTTQLMQSQLAEENDAQTVEELHIPGTQYNPPVSSRGFFGKIEEAWKIFVGIDDKIPKLTLSPGEKVDYASAAGAIVCSIRYNADGSIDITGPGDVNIIGNLNVTGDISADGDVIADALATAISLLTHLHIANLGGTSAVPQQGVVAIPDPAVVTGDVTIQGKSFITHTHGQGNDSDGDSEVETDAPT